MAKNKQQEKPTVSFDDMIKAGTYNPNRQKRKAENLAQEIFGKNRRQSAPQSNNNNNNNTTNNNNKRSQTPLGGSLASRVGITKARLMASNPPGTTVNRHQRSSSAASIPTLAKQQQNRAGQKNRNPRQSQGGADSRRDAAYQSAAQQAPPPSFNIKQRSFTAAADSEITIRGAAGPYCVVASNFAPGTTAADIESVMAPIGGEMSGCKLVATIPHVIAEMLFLDKAGAENVINMFNGKKADGRILYVYLKEGGPSQSVRSATPRVASPVVITEPEPVQEQGAEDTMDIEQPYPTEPSPLPPHEPSPHHAPYNNNNSRPPRDGRASYREDYDRGPRHAQPDYQDGRYGFNEQRYNEPRYDDRRPRYRDEGRMYSDDMMRGGSRRGGGGRGGGGRYRG